MRLQCGRCARICRQGSEVVLSLLSVFLEGLSLALLLPTQNLRCQSHLVVGRLSYVLPIAAAAAAADVLPPGGGVPLLCGALRQAPSQVDGWRRGLRQRGDSPLRRIWQGRQ
jgi:hypothetical protein